MLFFDKVLSGNRDTACATCHHPSFRTGDALSLGAGTGGSGLGLTRVLGPGRSPIPRNATELFNRGATDWNTMFWDFRITQDADGSLATPAGSQLPDDLDGVLAAQALFPVIGRDEMRGMPTDAIQGNEVCGFGDSQFTEIWDALFARLWSYPAYRELFLEAFPRVLPEELGFQHAANAIAAFEASAFVSTDSPWDRYLSGDDSALNPQARRGALLFYGRARCANCHSGPLLTDQNAHNLAMPQLGPGKPPESPLDFGCGRVTGKRRDRFSFRTPPLRNVAATGPWMHNGAYTTLAGAVRHHLDPPRALLSYDPSQLPPWLQATVQSDPATLRDSVHTRPPGQSADSSESSGCPRPARLPRIADQPDDRHPRRGHSRHGAEWPPGRPAL